MKLSPAPEIRDYAEMAQAFDRHLAGIVRVVVVTGPNVSRIPAFGGVLEAIGSSGREVSVWDGSRADPTFALVEEATAFARKHRAEAVVGVGGGSPLDTAKVVSALLAHPVAIDDLVGIDRIGGPCAPLVAIPTTAGTGSEVTNIAILTDERDDMKKGVISDRIVPRLAILAPELTLGLPPATTAATAMDALCHASEAYLSRKRNRYSDGMALVAVKLIAENLPKAMATPDDIEVRRALLEASLIAGLAFNNSSVTAIHAFAYPLGGRYHIPHGLANSLMFAPVMRHNLPSEPERFADLAEAFRGVRDGQAWIDGVDAMRRALPLPRTLAEAGVPRDDLESMADDVMTVTRLLSVNPREILRDDAVRIFHEAWSGGVP